MGDVNPPSPTGEKIESKANENETASPQHSSEKNDIIIDQTNEMNKDHALTKEVQKDGDKIEKAEDTENTKKIISDAEQNNSDEEKTDKEKPTDNDTPNKDRDESNLNEEDKCKNEEINGNNVEIDSNIAQATEKEIKAGPKDVEKKTTESSTVNNQEDKEDDVSSESTKSSLISEQSTTETKDSSEKKEGNVDTNIKQVKKDKENNPSVQLAAGETSPIKGDQKLDHSNDNQGGKVTEAITSESNTVITDIKDNDVHVKDNSQLESENKSNGVVSNDKKEQNKEEKISKPNNNESSSVKELNELIKDLSEENLSDKSVPPTESSQNINEISSGSPNIQTESEIKIEENIKDGITSALPKDTADSVSDEHSEVKKDVAVDKETNIVSNNVEDSTSEAVVKTDNAEECTSEKKNTSGTEMKNNSETEKVNDFSISSTNDADVEKIQDVKVENIHDAKPIEETSKLESTSMNEIPSEMTTVISEDKTNESDDIKGSNNTPNDVEVIVSSSQMSTDVQDQKDKEDLKPSANQETNQNSEEISSNNTANENISGENKDEKETTKDGKLEIDDTEKKIKSTDVVDDLDKVVKDTNLTKESNEHSDIKVPIAVVEVLSDDDCISDEIDIEKGPKRPPRKEKKKDVKSEQTANVVSPPATPGRAIKKKGLKFPQLSFDDASSKIAKQHAEFISSSIQKRLLMGAPDMEQAVQKMKEGSTLKKIRGLKMYPRHFHVDVESMSLRCETKKWWPMSSAVAGTDGYEKAVPLIEVVEIREGWKTDTFNKVQDHNERMTAKGNAAGEIKVDESHCFSLIYGSGGRGVLDLIAASVEERDFWVAGLSHLIECVRSLHQDRQFDLWLRNKFEEADQDDNKALTMDECLVLLHKLNLKLESKHVKKLFNDANTNKLKRDGQQVLDAQEFVGFYHSLQKMTEVENLFNKFASEEQHVMSAEQLLHFLHEEQKQTHLTLQDAVSLISQHEISSLKEKQSFSLYGFLQFLQSDSMNVYRHDHQSSVHQNMDYPLSHYYINSSHNTYLIGNQLSGESSVEGYISALKRGCRVLELDVWDGDDGEPIIYHGHTLTTKITLHDVLQDAIKQYAFVQSPYPVILSIENHLSLEQQKIMIKQFKEVLGDYLVTDPVPDDINVLPSPESLKHKILIKAKKPQGLEVEDDDEDDDQDNIDYIDSDDGAAQTKKNKPHKPLTPELREVVNVCEGKKFVSFLTSFESDKCVHFPSLRENKAKELLQTCPENFVKFTQRQISKVYPLGTRTDSSNLKPYPLWAVGAQVVTLNMQTEDKPTFYNDALFRSNGNCGFVLKPDVLLRGDQYDPNSPPPSCRRKLTVKVISGQHLPSSLKSTDIVDPYVQVKVRGHPADKQKKRTKTIKNNGFNPVWNDTLELDIKVADTSLVYFSVRDESSMAKDAVLALACIPFTSFGLGYRFVHLTTLGGESLAPAGLFVHISIE